MRRQKPKRGVSDCETTNSVFTIGTVLHADKGPEDDERLLHRFILGFDAHAHWIPHLGRGLRNRWEQRQEGILTVTSRQGFVEGQIP